MAVHIEGKPYAPSLSAVRRTFEQLHGCFVDPCLGTFPGVEQAERKPSHGCSLGIHFQSTSWWLAGRKHRHQAHQQLHQQKFSSYQSSVNHCMAQWLSQNLPLKIWNARNSRDMLLAKLSTGKQEFWIKISYKQVLVNNSKEGTEEHATPVQVHVCGHDHPSSWSASNWDAYFIWHQTYNFRGYASTMPNKGKYYLSNLKGPTTKESKEYQRMTRRICSATSSWWSPHHGTKLKYCRS